MCLLLKIEATFFIFLGNEDDLVICSRTQPGHQILLRQDNVIESAQAVYLSENCILSHLYVLIASHESSFTDTSSTTAKKLVTHDSIMVIEKPDSMEATTFFLMFEALKIPKPPSMTCKNLLTWFTRYRSSLGPNLNP